MELIAHASPEDEASTHVEVGIGTVGAEIDGGVDITVALGPGVDIAVEVDGVAVVHFNVVSVEVGSGAVDIVKMGVESRQPAESMLPSLTRGGESVSGGTEGLRVSQLMEHCPLCKDCCNLKYSNFH
jgi:hypothetical protein